MVKGKRAIRHSVFSEERSQIFREDVPERMSPLNGSARTVPFSPMTVNLLPSGVRTNPNISPFKNENDLG